MKYPMKREKYNMANELAIIESKRAIAEILDTIKDLPVMTKEDHNFLVEHRDHLATVSRQSFMWRTDNQKMSIVSDTYHPTLHSKFHQAILEQKVQFEQTLFLSKDFEMKKLEIEELSIEVDELNKKLTEETFNEFDKRRFDVQKKKKELEIRFKEFELNNQQIAMHYRMDEVKGWQNIEEQLMVEMKNQGMSDEEIWDKELGEVEDMFYMFLTNMQGIQQSKDGGEITNLYALAKFGVDQAKQIGKFDEWKKRCNSIQKHSLQLLGEVI